MSHVTTGVLLDDRYHIVARRAAGATATVWEAQDEFLRRRVAVKILHDHLAADTDLQARFVDEARTAATVNHPALVAVYDSIVDAPGIVLEWIEGPDLRQRLDQGPIPPGEVAEIGIVICGGLTALHEHGLVHRDVKPANILLDAAGRAKLTDFGIATANAGDRTATGIVLGTAKYLAPEQVRGARVDGRTDVFALAAVLYEALAGQPPWARDGDLPTALARLEEDAPDLRLLHPEVPVPLATAVMRGLAREPEDRWPNASTFADALGGASMLPPPPTRSATTDATTALVGSPAAERGSSGRRELTVPPRPLWPRMIGGALVVAIALLGWTLIAAIADTDPSTPTRPDSGAADSVLTVVGADAFDPEGSGPPGEHDELAGQAIDGNPATAWVTERYADRDLGAKSGVGLVLTLDEVSDIEAVTIATEGGAGWAVQIHVATGVTVASAGGIADFGDPRGGGTGLDEEADLAVDGRGDTIVLWFTDLGAGNLPIRLTVSEVTVR